jgi:hypothetical protein
MANKSANAVIVRWPSDKKKIHTIDRAARFSFVLRIKIKHTILPLVSVFLCGIKVVSAVGDETFKAHGREMEMKLLFQAI